ncbi:sensor histidine kinase [Parabacteroides sp.]
MSIVLSIIIIMLLIYIIYVQRKTKQDIDEFAESIINKDFSRKHPRYQAITDAFLHLAGEKEAQQHYLKEMLDLVDTGILAYDVKTYETLWMNDSFTTMLNIPHIKNINWLKKQNEGLFKELLDIPVNKSTLITIHARKQTVKTMTNASVFETGGKTYKLIAFHNVSATMEEVESSAWKGLLNVMTHEIMNSIVPVSSLSDTLRKKIQALKEKTAELSDNELEDMELAMDTIHRRSEGLLRFAETYRNLSQKIVPDMKLYNLYDLLSSIHSLMNPSLQQKGIVFTLKTDDPDVTASIDRDLIEQVIINFVTNATYATREKEDPQIYLFSGRDTEGYPYITVADNGSGIPDTIRDKIFIPFFSTKKNGNGIGLSISREIIKLHNGKLHAQSEEKKGSAFTVLFSSPTNIQ